MLTETASPPTVSPAHPTPPVSRPVEAPARGWTHWRRIILSLSPASWACLDLLIVGVATCVAQILLRHTLPGYQWVTNSWVAIAAFCACHTLAGLVIGVYEPRTLLSRSGIVLRTTAALALGVVLALACLAVFLYADYSRWVGLIVSVCYLLVALPARLLAHEVVTTSRVRILCIGDGPAMRRLAAALQHTRRHFQTVGHVVAAATVQQETAAAPGFHTPEDEHFERVCPRLGGLSDLAGLLPVLAIDEIVVSPELTANAAVGRAVAVALDAGCRVTDQPTFVEKLLGEVPAESVHAAWLLGADVQNHGSYEAIKRMLDVTAAAAGLLLTLPLWPLIALAIRLDSRGPVLYSQTRTGRNGRCFTIYKFRTMRMDAEADGARWATANDNRVTRLGRFLRRSRLDELPQLINILRGDMALVGPRPERPEFVHNLAQVLPNYRLRLLVKPGLTGWAQINYGYGASVADAHRKLCFDLYYLKHRSLDLDLAILMRTFGTFLLGAR